MSRPFSEHSYLAPHVSLDISLLLSYPYLYNLLVAEVKESRQ
jgi:hypothetical protein